MHLRARACSRRDFYRRHDGGYPSRVHAVLARGSGCLHSHRRREPDCIAGNDPEFDDGLGRHGAELRHQRRNGYNSSVQLSALWIS